MYIKQAFNFTNDWWLYIAGIMIIFIGIIVGQIPHTIALVYKAFQQGGDLDALKDPYELLKLLDSNLNLFLMLLSFAIGLLALLLVVKYIHKQSFTSLTTARNSIDWNRFWFAFLVWGAFTIGSIVLMYISEPENYVLNFDPVPFTILVLISIIFIPLQTSFEEYLFRGYLMQGLGILAKNKWVPLILTSTMFGLMHFANPEVEKLGQILLIHYVGTGFLLGIMTLMDDGLELALGFHAANNLFAALLMTADWTVFQTNSILKDISEPELVSTEFIVPLLIIYPLVLFIFSKKYNWNNWQDKLFGTVIKD